MNLTTLKQLLDELIRGFEELIQADGRSSRLRTEKLYVRVRKPFNK